MATQTSLAMAGARVAGIPPVNVPGLINPPVRKKGFIGAISSSGWFLHFSLNKLLTQESFNLVPLYNGRQKKQQQKDGILYPVYFLAQLGCTVRKGVGLLEVPQNHTFLERLKIYYLYFMILSTLLSLFQPTFVFKRQ